ncbi:MAG: glycine cleavage T C-terminal barrel domain-containing protein [Candidatus Limnocylindria bacterium]
MAFDMSLVQRGARLRRSPFYEAEQAYGPRGYTVYNHMLFPTSYDDFEAEYWHLLRHVTLWDVAVERQLEVQGRDGFRFAQLLTPRDLSKCAVGQGKYVVITTPAGGIVNDPVMLRLGENHFWFALASSDALLYAMGLAASLDWDVQLGEPDVSPVQIQGPRSKDVVAALFGDDIRSLKYYWFWELDLDGIPVVVTRTGWSAEVGYEIYLRDGRHGTALWERIMEAGRPFEIRPTGPSDIRRVEGGILNWGADMTTEHNPFEAGLERLCNLDGDFEFMGKEALLRARANGLRRRLVGVAIDGDRLDMNFTKWPIQADGAPVGQVTTALWSPRLERNIGYAWLPIERADTGNQVRVTTPDGERGATVVPMPFIDPTKEIPKS